MFGLQPSLQRGRWFLRGHQQRLFSSLLGSYPPSVPVPPDQENRFLKAEVKLSSYDLRSLEKFVSFARNVGEVMEAETTTEICKIGVWRTSVNKSNSRYKRHQRQFEIRTYRRNLKLFNMNQDTFDTYIQYILYHSPEELDINVEEHTYENPNALQVIMNDHFVPLLPTYLEKPPLWEVERLKKIDGRRTKALRIPNS
eukprot:Lithocolla_globosa_v1_NODE_9847_length_662_cov_3.227348.p1 type:complete len:198 gc:universal NODE_9847_length_662_cov_3.227348:647-54(-)